MLSLHKYAQHHFAVDCENCDRKIATLEPSYSAGEIIDQINRHLVRVHGKAE